MAKPTICGVHIQTWGTDPNAGEGIWMYLRRWMFGGNIGHAAIAVTIPANVAGKAIIDKYCLNQDGSILIPHRKIHFKYPNGEFEDAYEVRFSWWPDADDEGVATITTDEARDRIDERDTVSINWRSFLGNEAEKEKTFSGILGTTTVQLGPMVTAHRRDLEIDEDLSKILDLCSNSFILTDKLIALETLSEKISNINPRKLTKTHKNLFINALDNPNEFLSNNGRLSKEKYKLLLDTIKDSKQKIDIAMSETLRQTEELKKNLNVEQLMKFERFVDDYFIIGTLESGSIYLPIKTFPDSKVGVSNGLNAEAMIKEMHALIGSGMVFDFVDKNCSETIGRILAAGVEQVHLKKYATKKVYSSVGSPQSIYNAGCRIQRAISEEEQPSFWNSLQDFHPIQTVVGRMSRIIIDNKSSIFKVIPASVILIIFLPIALLVEGIAWVVNNIINLLSVKPFAKRIKYVETISDSTESQVGKYLKNKIMDIQTQNYITDIKQLIQTLAYSTEIIPVLSEKSKFKIYELISSNNELPTELKEYLVTLPLDFQQQLQFDKLSQLVAALQELTLQRMKLLSEPEIQRVLNEKKGRMILSEKPKDQSQQDATTPNTNTENKNTPTL